MRFTLILETFIVPRGMKLSALISNPDHESIFKIPWLQSMWLYSSLRVHLCQEMENYVDVPQRVARRLALVEDQCSLRVPDQYGARDARYTPWLTAVHRPSHAGGSC